MTSRQEPGRPDGILSRVLRPAIGFNRPSDVLKDADLPRRKKRAILASWASDACAVEGKPHLRWALGAEDPVLLDEVLEAMARLDEDDPPPLVGRLPPRRRRPPSGPRLA